MNQTIYSSMWQFGAKDQSLTKLPSSKTVFSNKQTKFISDVVQSAVTDHSK